MHINKMTYINLFSSSFIYNKESIIIDTCRMSIVAVLVMVVEVVMLVVFNVVIFVVTIVHGVVSFDSAQSGPE